MSSLFEKPSPCLALRLAIGLGIVLMLFMPGCGGTSDDTKSGLGVDKAFLEVLLPREQSSFEMSQVARQRARSKVVRKLAVRAASERQARITRIIDFASRFPGASAEPVPLEATGKRFPTTESIPLGRNFDVVYLGSMVAIDQELLEAISEVQASGSDPGVKTIANETRAQLGGELARLRSAQRSLAP